MKKPLLTNLILLICTLLFNFTLYADITILVGSNGNSFTPASTTVGVGEKITWSFVGGIHNVKSSTTPNGAPSFYSGAAQTSGTFEYTPTVPGVYVYFCELHGGMNGSFTVTSPPITGVITTGTLSTLTYCGEGAMQIPYTSTGNFPAGGSFKVQFSNATGSFSNPILANPVSTSANQLTVNVPLELMEGNGYRVRVVHTGGSTSIIGTDNGQDLTVFSDGFFMDIGTDQGRFICTGTTINFYSTITGNTNLGKYVWTSSASNGILSTLAGFSSSSITDGEIITLTYSSQSKCSSTISSRQDTISIRVSSQVNPVMSISGIYDYPNYCTQSHLYVNSTITGGGATPSIIWSIKPTSGNPFTATGFNNTILSGFTGTISGKLNSSLACATPTTATSNVIILEPLSTPGVTDIPVNITSSGSVLSIVSDMIPTTFSWYKNGSLINITTTSFAPTASGNYELKYVNNVGCPANTPGYSFTYSGPTAITSTAEKQVYIYPNPATEKVLVATDGKEVSIKIFSIEGSKVIDAPLEQSAINEVNIRSLVPGFYIIEIADKKKILLRTKLLKQ